MSRLSLFVLLLSIVLPTAAQTAEPQRLTITTWGGAYEASQRAAYFEPFETTTGIGVDLRAYNGGLEPLRAARDPDGVGWDVLDMTEPDARAACAEGLLARFDPQTLLPAPNGTPAADDFLADSFLDCGVIHLVYATVLAYDDRAFPGDKPRTVVDFFDVERFPGKRALRRQPIALLEWALLSYGIPISQLYDLLSTERGLALAFRRLDSLRDHIVWWDSGSEPPELLKSGRATMAAGFNGRFFNARVNDGVPITVMWDGQFLDTGVWAIAKDTPRRALAERFVRFATRSENMAELARHIPYGPARHSAIRRIGLHARSRIPMLNHMPTAPAHLETAIRADSEWYARTEDLRQRRFRDWLAKEPKE